MTRSAALLHSRDEARHANVPFHEVVKAFRAAARCPTCGKSTAVLNVARRGFIGEPVKPETHCTCVGGPAYVVPAPVIDETVEVCEHCGISAAQALFYGENGCRGSGGEDIGPFGSGPGPIIGDHSFVRVTAAEVMP